MADIPILTLLLVLSAAGAAAALLVPKRYAGAVALAFAVLVFLLSLLLVLPHATTFSFDYAASSADPLHLQLGEAHPWIDNAGQPDHRFGIWYRVGVDGLSLPMVFLSTLMTMAAIAYAIHEPKRPNEFFGLLLVMQVGVLGVFTAQDYFVFYIFWEIVLIPMYFLIGIWGGPRRDYAAIKFFIYTHVASVIMVIGIMALVFENLRLTGVWSFAFADIAASAPQMDLVFKGGVFAALFFGFAVKMPVVPFHTWLPDAHVEAPTAGSVLLAAILLKMGAYGLLRIAFQTFPDVLRTSYSWYGIDLPETRQILAFLGVVSIIYGAFICLAQRDLKKLIAYSSISHMGLVLYGMSTTTGIGISGAVLQMFAHGLISGALFMVVGSIHHGTGTRDIPKLGGLAQRLPLTAAVLVVASMASLGLPGLASFVSELTVFTGGYQAYGLVISPVSIAIPIMGVLITAAYYIWALQRVLFGPFVERGLPMHDLPRNEKVVLLGLLVLIAFFGIWPAAILDMSTPGSFEVASLIGGLTAGGR